MNDMNQKILIIDDSPMNLSVLEEMLAKYSYELFLAKSGEDGLKIAAEVMPDLILLDILMPNMNGFDTLDGLRKIKSLQKIPVIFITALDDDDSKIRAFEAGAVDYISKPFNAREVAARVKAHLGVSRLTISLDFLLKLSAHEFGVPLSVIDTSIQMQRMEYEDSEYIRAISSASTTLHGVYKNMAYFLTSESKILQPQAVKIGELVKNRVNYLKVLAAAYDNSFEIVEVDENLNVYISELELERVVDNILSNAAKHSIKGSAIKVVVAQKDEEVFFEVENKSRRIENAARMFEEFYKDKNAANGMGLGLHLVLRICEKNGAKITSRCEDQSVFFRVSFKGYKA
jgi:two-component system sensor histidine kinase/response regulator